jgi:glycosyltransferase involved in cell wall biosynthesis
MKHSKEVIDKIKQNKKRIKSLKPYNEKPKTCAILLSFNHSYNVDQLHKSIVASNFDEVIVCEDGSIDGSYEKWGNLLDHKNHYLIRSLDIHELRAYEKAIKMSDSDIFCLLQDDDFIPEDSEWLNEAVLLFNKYPDLAILGGARGRDLSFHKTYGVNSTPIPFIDPDTGKDFMFVQNLNIGPYFMRKDVFHKLKGWDKRCSNAGEPGILFESEICYRAWLAGYQVALCNMPFKMDDDDRGTMIFNEGADENGKNGVRQRNCQRNINLMRYLYTKHEREISTKILELNKKHLRRKV